MVISATKSQHNMLITSYESRAEWPTNPFDALAEKPVDILQIPMMKM